DPTTEPLRERLEVPAVDEAREAVGVEAARNGGSLPLPHPVGLDVQTQSLLGHQRPQPPVLARPHPPHPPSHIPPPHPRPAAPPPPVRVRLRPRRAAPPLPPLLQAPEPRAPGSLPPPWADARHELEGPADHRRSLPCPSDASSWSRGRSASQKGISSIS